MDDNRIIELYNNGYSIDYISKSYYKFKNRNFKPIFIDGIKLYPSKIYTKIECKNYVMQIIYSYILNKDNFLYQT